jgi:hypothetical protein
VGLYFAKSMARNWRVITNTVDDRNGLSSAEWISRHFVAIILRTS